jgi:hypothetical protein
MRKRTSQHPTPQPSVLTPNDVNVLTRNHVAMENSNHASGPEPNSLTNGNGEQGVRIAGVSYHNTDFAGNVDTTTLSVPPEASAAVSLDPANTARIRSTLVCFKTGLCGRQ